MDQTTSSAGESLGEDRGDKGAGALSRYGRRAILLGAGAAGAGLAVTLAGGADPAAAADNNPVELGDGNTASASTVITTSGGNGLNGVTTSDETYSCGLLGQSTSGTGVYGTQASTSGLLGSDENPDTAAVVGDSGAGVGVLGLSSTTNGVQGVTSADGGYGVYGISTVGGIGVYGTSAQSAGVLGRGATVGVQGDDSLGGTCIGVEASLRNSSNPSPALQAETAGTGSAVEASIDNPSNSSPALFSYD